MQSKVFPKFIVSGLRVKRCKKSLRYLSSQQISKYSRTAIAYVRKFMTITPLSPKLETATAATSNAVLSNISWQTYQAMLADMGDYRAIRLAYNRGTLEIKMPLEFHEAINRLLERLIVTLTEELGFIQCQGICVTRQNNIG